MWLFLLISKDQNSVSQSNHFLWKHFLNAFCTIYDNKEDLRLLNNVKYSIYMRRECYIISVCLGQRLLWQQGTFFHCLRVLSDSSEPALQMQSQVSCRPVQTCYLFANGTFAHWNSVVRSHSCMGLAWCTKCPVFSITSTKQQMLKGCQESKIKSAITSHLPCFFHQTVTI